MLALYLLPNDRISKRALSRQLGATGLSLLAARTAPVPPNGPIYVVAETLLSSASSGWASGRAASA